MEYGQWHKTTTFMGRRVWPSRGVISILKPRISCGLPLTSRGSSSKAILSLHTMMSKKCGRCFHGTLPASLAMAKETCGGSQIRRSVNCGASAARPDQTLLLFCSVGAVAGVAQAGHNEGLRIELIVDGGRPDRNVGMNRTY